MDLDKVILYYGFTPIADTDAMKLWQKSLCESLNITGGKVRYIPSMID